MALDADLGPLDDLAAAIGLTSGGGFRPGWFQDPLGEAGDSRGLTTVLYHDEQREALVAFVDEALGSPDRRTEDGAVWVPLVSNEGLNVYAVIDDSSGPVTLGVAAEYRHGTEDVEFEVRASVQAFQVARDGHSLPATEVPWLLLGQPGGVIDLDVTLTSRTAAAPGEFHLGGATIGASIPTADVDDLAVRVALNDLQLPGATTGRDHELDLDDLDQADEELLRFVVGLLRAQADALDGAAGADTAPFAAVASLLGLRTTAGLPTLPLEELPDRGVDVLVEWLESTLTVDASRDAWLAQLADLFGATADPARDAVTVTTGAFTAALGLRSTTGANGSPVLTPWLDVAVRARAGVEARATADLFAVDTASGSLTAFPALGLTVVFGEAASGGSALLTPDPGSAGFAIGSTELGLLVLAGDPRFSLLLHQVVTPSGRRHERLDLSSPEAVRDAADGVVEAELVALLDRLGSPGQTIGRLIGLTPPTGIEGTSAVDLLTDPLGATGAYWQRLTGDRAALAEVVQALIDVVLPGTVDLTEDGEGTEASPWRLPIDRSTAGPTAELVAWLDGTTIAIDVVVSHSTAVLARYECELGARLGLLRFDTTTPTVDLATDLAATLALRSEADDAIGIDVGRASITLDGLEVGVGWKARRGLRLDLDVPGLAVDLRPLGGSRIPITLPRVTDNGGLDWDPDWADIEDVLAALLGLIDDPVVLSGLELIGWFGDGAHLALADLIDDPVAGLRRWLAELVLDCDNVRAALGPVARLLSGFGLDDALGAGSRRRPFRAPIGGEPSAPGLAAWLTPPCPVALDDYETRPGQLEASPDLRAGDLVDALREAATALPDIGDLLVGRDSLDLGLEQLVDRLAGTDGVVGRPVVLPDGVTGHEVAGAGYVQLVAMGARDRLLPRALGTTAPDRLYVGVEELWATAFDGSVDPRPGAAGAGAAIAGPGPWSASLPTVSEAAAQRLDGDGRTGQAETIVGLLGDRTEPVTLIAYGQLGQAAMVAAGLDDRIARVVTVGSPWAPMSTEAFRRGLSGDALRLLRTLAGPAAEWPEASLASEPSPATTVRALLDRLTTGPAGTPPGPEIDELSDVSTVARPDAIPIDAVFGRLTAGDAWWGISALVEDAIADAFDVLDGDGGEGGDDGDPPDDDDAPVERLDLGIDLPIVDLDLGGIRLGAGIRLDCFAFDRDQETGELRVGDDRRVAVETGLGLTDRWLVGGPTGLQNDVEVRRVGLEVVVPLGGGDPETRLILHEARCFDVFRQRWVVDAEHLLATPDATTSLPEVHLIMAEVVKRLLPAAGDDGGAGRALADLLAALGLVRDGGYDPDGLERLVFDPDAVADSLLADPTGLADLLRALPSPGTLAGPPVGVGSTLEWRTAAGPTSTVLTLDLAGRSIAVQAASTPAGLLTLGLDARFAAGSFDGQITLGSIDGPTGGLEVVADIQPTTGGHRLLVRWAGAGDAIGSEVDLLAGTGLDRLPSLLAALLPAGLARIGLDLLRDRMETDHRIALDAVLDGLGLLDRARAAADLARFGEGEVSIPVRLPLGLFLDPVGWLRHGAESWRQDPLGQAVDLLDALRPLAGLPAPDEVPAADGERAWPLTDELSLRYRLSGDRGLLVSLATDIDHVVDGRTVSTGVAGGLSLTMASGRVSVAPAASARFTVDGTGALLRVDPGVVLSLVRSSGEMVRLYPAGGDVGSVVESAAAMVVPAALNALRDGRADPVDSPTRTVGRVTHAFGGALDLLEADRFTEARLTSFAGDPIGRFRDRLTAIAAASLGPLVDAIDSPLITRSGDRIVIADGDPAVDDGVGYIGLRFVPGIDQAVEIDAALPVADVGRFTLDRLRIGQAGLQVTTGYTGRFDAGRGVVLQPMVAISAGADGLGFSRNLELGLQVGADEATFGLRWGLDGSAPTLFAGGDGDPALNLALFALSLASSVTIDLAAPLIGPRARPVLSGVLLDPAAPPDRLVVDQDFFFDLFDLDALRVRLFRLLANLGDAGLSVEFGSDPALELGYFGGPRAGGNEYGLTLSIGGDGRFDLTEGDTRIQLEVDDSWLEDTGPAGLTLVALHIDGDGQFSFAPRIVARGLGVRVAKQAGPLLDLGPLGIDAIALHLYGESNPAGAGVGAQLRLDGLAFTPSGNGEANPVAAGIMSDATESGGPNARPSFSPSLAVRRPAGPGRDVEVSVRAGPPPGPWWLAIQRELGPLYLERFGFDSVEEGGSVVGISLLFDGRVSLFGLTAEVDQLGIHWTGGSVTDGDNWRVDIQGFAVAADLSGIFISGGLLKTELDGNTGYLGMLTGRFSAYGLSLFGGYTKLGDTPSFFIFGAVNGPIGGPPAFFVTGIGGGLGINRGLRVPSDIDKLGEYPFIRALDTGTSSELEPMEQIRDLDRYFPVEDGNIWFAAGISFTCFSLVDGIAVVSVSFGSGLDINLLGLARMMLPRPEAALVSIELGLLARFSTEEGLFLIQAQLTDNSWLLYPEVRLTGGFAFATWWKGPNAGQFVLTLGGYHPTFSRPGYPEVPRLGLVWQVSNAIVVKGESYFALTSEALMAGLDVEVSADFGFAWARLAFGAHGIVYFDPFWFQVSAYVSVSAGIRIKTWFGTIRISISLGASVLVEGPDVSGVATVEVGPAEFDVPFGSRDKDRRPAVSWAELVAKYLEESSPGVANAISGVAGRGALPASTDGGDNAPSPDGSYERPFEVFAEFELLIVTSVPFNRLVVDEDDPIDTGSRLHLSPMQVTAVTSTLGLELRRSGVSRADRAGILAELADGLDPTPVGDLDATTGAGYGVGGFPLGVWGPPNDAEAEVKPLPSTEVVFAGNRVKLVSRAVAESGEDGRDIPPIPYGQVEHDRRRLPLSAVGTSRADLLGVAGGFDEVAVSSAEQAIATARAVLFERSGSGAGSPSPAPAPATTRAPGRSRLARSTYRGSRTAPPLFGTLAEGLDVGNPAAATTEVIEPEPTGPRRANRPPLVVGHVGTGAGQPPTPAVTTVGDKRIKRRRAPSTDSVRGRLGTSLPIDLHLRQAPAPAGGESLVALGSSPHTETVTPWAVTDAERLDDLTEALLPASGNDATVLPAGETVVVALPDGADDDRQQRPTLTLGGPARLVAVGAGGTVLADRSSPDDQTSARSGQIPVPAGATRLAILAGGTPPPTPTVGWHTTSRLLWIGSGSAVGSGCVVSYDTQGTARRVGWYSAGRLAAAASVTTTWFSDRPSTLAVVVADAEPGTLLDDGRATLDGIGIELRGLRRRPARIDGGGDQPVPVTVRIGSATVVIVAVEPDPDDPAPRPRVRCDGGRHRVVGVLGSELTPDELARSIALHGLTSDIADLTTRPRPAGERAVKVRWEPAPDDDLEDGG